MEYKIIKKNKRGFTIVELLVVVAIIAVLAAIVLVNVTQYISRGKNASIKGNLSTVATNAGVYYDANSSYTGFCGTSNFTNPQAAIAAAGGSATCNVDAGGTAVCACSSEVGSTNTFCVDSSGAKKETTTDCVTECGSTGSCQ